MLLKFENISYYSQLMRLDKPIGTLLLLWPTLWGLWISSKGIPSLIILIIFCLGVFLMRSAGCVINDYADRELDKHVNRTKNRPLTSGKVTEKEALALFLSLSITSFILVLFLNQLTIFLSIIALFLAALYPFMKRYTYYPQLFLGLAFSWSIPMSFAANNADISIITWILYIATILWIIAYDTQYAMVDREDDLKIGIKSTAIAFGTYDKLLVFLLHLLSLMLLAITGLLLDLKISFYIGLLSAFIISLYQQWLIKDRVKEQCFKAFLNNNWFGLVIFIGLFLNYL
ncbi:MAG: 4-hydroxybenzoate octaprenyltransferase [Gammaproteobacteria bacterium]|nr:4-hydroxybenzoate octaprenyltransferase [Gammaproteobacteria bacterium]